ncbi:MAG: hypothetical protein M3342_14040, partial [Bacteroidota bacterium]|nr:hypothetical protein [Bacteroidota bacterium]
MRNLLLFLFILSLLFACRKESFTTNTDALLKTDIDTLQFDTVFTTTGSVTQLFKIINTNNRSIKISSVRLAGGATSPFRINVDGMPGPHVNEVEIAGKDSAYVFATVTIHPTNASLPFVVRDSIEISYNGNKKWVQLEAFGKNAHFLRNKLVQGNETWNADLPYVILGGLLVDDYATLTINKGCRIYVHADVPIFVQGTLRVAGEKWDSTRVVFSGDRLDEPYRDFPASFPGIFFTAGSKNNVFQYAIIKNAYQGIVAVDPSPVASPKITLNETIIDNAYDIGLLGVNTSITARNVLISNSGKNLVLIKGGDYSFTHCTVASYSNNYSQHKDPVLLVSNFLEKGAPSFPITAVFRNCIFWGDDNGTVDNEAVVLKNGTTPFNVTFNNVLWRLKEAPANITVTEAISNQPPQFDSVNNSKRYYN